jgi:hypothetical protein
MFGALTSFTGGGGLSTSATASADGDNTFANDFSYKNGAVSNAGLSSNNLLLGVALVFVGVIVIKVIK